MALNCPILTPLLFNTDLIYVHTCIHMVVCQLYHNYIKNLEVSLIGKQYYIVQNA